MITEDESGDTLALEARKGEVKTRLDGFKVVAGDETTLSRYWVDDLMKGVGDSIGRASKRGQRTAMVVQYADAMLSYGPDAKYVDGYLGALGAKAVFEDRIVEASIDNLPKILDDPELRKIKGDALSGEAMNNLPEGSMLVTDEIGGNKYLILETDIEGVRLLLDGSITSKNVKTGIIRAMLLIKIGNAKVSYYEPEIVDNRKTWSEVHGRKPGSQRRAGEDYYEKELGKAAVENDDLGLAVREIGYMWQGIPKSGEEIKVTPTKVKTKPALATEQERRDAVTQAYDMAIDHLHNPKKYEGKEVVGATTAMLVNMTDVLGMTPWEIEKDGEALSDLLEYLKQVAMATEGIYGPSSILPNNTKEGDPIMELVLAIEDTYDLPERQGFHNFMEDRVTYQKRQPPGEVGN